MQPWEETWRIIGRNADSSNKLGISPTVSIGRIPSDERARLAAQAPAMARLLLSGPQTPEVIAVLQRAGVLPVP